MRGVRLRVPRCICGRLHPDGNCPVVRRLERATIAFAVASLVWLHGVWWGRRTGEVESANLRYRIKVLQLSHWQETRSVLSINRENYYHLTALLKQRECLIHYATAEMRQAFPGRSLGVFDQDWWNTMDDVQRGQCEFGAMVGIENWEVVVRRGD